MDPPVNPEEESSSLRDRISGMFSGQFLGDALGAPHEHWQWNRDTIYTGRLEIEPYKKGGSYYHREDIYQPVGSVTDDTQMTLALFIALEKNDFKYDRDTAIVWYSKWTHSGARDMGKNTRYLFKNITVTGYESRLKTLNQEIKSKKRDISLANGALMRCSPLALLDDWENAVIADCNLTNPYPETLACNLIYVSVLRSALLGVPLVELIELARSETLVYSKKYDAWRVQWASDVALECKNDIDISGKDKGLAIYGFYCALRGLILLSDGYSYRSIIRWVITQGTKTGQGDTDTNASITGALIGAVLGYDKIMESQITKSNWNILLDAADEVEGALAQFVPTDFDSLVDECVTVIR